MSHAIRPSFAPITQQINQIVLGKPTTIQLALTCLLANGHLLLEDVPGVGKTTLAHTLAVSLGLAFKRVQFTNDLLPADLLGVSIYERTHAHSPAEQNSGRFVFHPGPAFTQVLLADEINRATPKTQSAMLEAMEERQVTVEGIARPLPQPFFVIATQNPLDSAGTFPLPESQLDRFLMRLSLGYPDATAERALLAGEDRRHLLHTLQAQMDTAQLLAAQAEVARVHASSAILDYLQALLHASRHHAELAHGLSPRAGLALLQAARAWAWLSGRDFLQPEDVQAVFPHVVSHRLKASNPHTSITQLVTQLLQQVAIR